MPSKLTALRAYGSPTLLQRQLTGMMCQVTSSNSSATILIRTMIAPVISLICNHVENRQDFPTHKLIDSLRVVSFLQPSVPYTTPPLRRACSTFTTRTSVHWATPFTLVAQWAGTPMSMWWWIWVSTIVTLKVPFNSRGSNFDLRVNPQLNIGHETVRQDERLLDLVDPSHLHLHWQHCLGWSLRPLVQNWATLLRAVLPRGD